MSDFESLCLYLAIYSISAVFIGLWSKRKLWIAAIIGLALPIILAALRYPVGTDFWTYLQMWDRSGLLTYEDIFQHLYQEPLFHLISKLTCNYGNEKWFFGLCAGLTLIPAIISFKKQFKGHYIALFAFLFLLTNFTGSFNIMRQYIAVSFTFVASAYIFKRDIRKFAFWIIIAMMFHLSATIFAPAYFIYSKVNS